MAQQSNERSGSPSSKGFDPTPIEGSGQGIQGLAPTTGSSSSGSQAGSAAATARSFIDQAKQTAGQAYEAVTDTAASKLDEKKATVSEGLSSVADSIRQVGDNVQPDNPLTEYAASYSRTAAEKVEQVANYFERTDVRGMARDIEDYARLNPAVVIAAAFGIGVLAARFFKSSKPDRFTGAEFGNVPRNTSPGSNQF